MSQAPEPLYPRRSARRYALVVALFCGALYLALLVAVFGFIALASNADVVSDERYSDFLGPMMAGVSVVTVTVLLALRAPRESDYLLDWGYSLLVGLVAALSYMLAGFLGAAAELGADDAVKFSFRTLFGGYDLAIAVLAFLTGLAYSFVIARRYDERGRPRWTWEDDFDA